MMTNIHDNFQRPTVFMIISITHVSTFWHSTMDVCLVISLTRWLKEPFGVTYGATRRAFKTDRHELETPPYASYDPFSECRGYRTGGQQTRSFAGGLFTASSNNRRERSFSSATRRQLLMDFGRVLLDRPPAPKARTRDFVRLELRRWRGERSQSQAAFFYDVRNTEISVPSLNHRGNRVEK